MGSWRGLFNIHTLNTAHWYSHATFLCVFSLCGIAIQHSCFIVIHNSTPIFQNPIFNLFNSTLRIDNSTSIFVSNTIHMRHSFVCSTSTFVASNAWWVCFLQSAICLQRNATFLFGHWTFPFRSVARILRLMAGVRPPDWRHHTILTSHEPILLEEPRKKERMLVL